MGKRNLTLQVDEELIKDAKVVAAKRGTSVSGLVAAHLKELVAREKSYDEAREFALRSMREAVPRGGITWTRDELYDRSQSADG
ncbi:MAG: DUF6364 family protein [Actinomycetota bacterium]